MQERIKQELYSLAESDFQRFSSTLIPGVNNMLGVRLPKLRLIAKRIAREDDWRMYLEQRENLTFEETMLQGMIIGCAKADLEERLHYAEDFIPRISNWAVCDSFCNDFAFKKEERERVWFFLQPYLEDYREFFARVGVVMLLSHFVSEGYIERILMRLDKVPCEAFYAKMSVAWALSVCFVKFPEKTLAYLHGSNLDNITYNKALQKILDSRRVDAERKMQVRRLKRK